MDNKQPHTVPEILNHFKTELLSEFKSMLTEARTVQTRELEDIRNMFALAGDGIKATSSPAISVSITKSNRRAKLSQAEQLQQSRQLLAKHFGQSFLTFFN